MTERPGSTSDRPIAPAALIETHISTVFLVGDHAYKLKKAVEFPFADLRTREARERLCHREVELNRRLAPDVYLGVADVLAPDGSPCDHLVAMRRMPDDRRLSTLVTDGDERVNAVLGDLGRLLARFHRDADRSPRIDRAGEPEAIARRWHDNFDEMRPFVGDVLDADTIERATQLADAYIAGRGRLFAHRIDKDRICDGHGDLQADDVFCLDDGPRVLDCIEFCDELRHADVAEDLAFLAMDLERLGSPSLAEELLGAYEAESGTTVPRGLLRFYVAYRAQVRAKVACLRAAQLGADDVRAEQRRADAAKLLDLCVRALGDALPRLVIVGGLPGTGKTTVATGIARTLGIELLRSDVVRKTLAGITPDTSAVAPFEAGIYTPAMTTHVYDELLARARQELELGHSVVLDAAFTRAPDRARARELAAQAQAGIVELRCTLPAAIAARRMDERRRRSNDASDADAAVAEAMAQSADPWPEAADLATSHGAHVVLTHALREVIHAPTAPAPLNPLVPPVPLDPAGAATAPGAAHLGRHPGAEGVDALPGAPVTSVIVPVDGSARSEAALDVGHELAHRFGAELRVLTATADGDTTEAETYLNRLVLEHAAGHAELDVRTGPAAPAIEEAVSATPGALLCMSTHGHGRLGEVLLGSVASDVLHLASRPVVLVGPDVEPPDDHATNLVVCWDGSRRSRRIVPVASAWASALGLSVRLLHVRWPADPGYGLAVSEELRFDLDGIAEELGRAGVPSSWHVLDDPDTADALVAELSPSTALALATSHGKGGARGVSHAALGSVVAKVVRSSRRPVLVLPSGD